MTVESVTYISDLDPTYPAEGESGTLHEGNNHLRNIKTALKATFPNLDAAVTASASELNYLDGVTSNIQDQLDAKSDATHDHDGDTLGAVTLGDGSVATTQPQSDNSTLIATTGFVASAIAALAGIAGAWAELAVASVSATSEVAFSSELDGTLYDHYQIIVDDLNTAASAVVQLQIMEASSAMATASAYSWSAIDTAANASSASASNIAIGADNISAQAFVIDVGGLHITAQPTNVTWQWTSGKKAAARFGGGSRNVAAAGNGIKLKTSTGAMRGTVVLLGRKL
jgi:hypothetical protein